MNRDDWVKAATKVLARSGVDRVRVEPLAAKLGVTKGSFYWHFEDRRALLNAVVDRWEAKATQDIIDAVNAHGGSARARLEALWTLATEERPAAELALRNHGDRDAAIAEAVERVDRTRMRFLRGLFRELGFEGPEVEARSLLLYALLIGDHFIRTGHGRMSRQRVLEHARGILMEATER